MKLIIDQNTFLLSMLAPIETNNKLVFLVAENSKTDTFSILFIREKKLSSKPSHMVFYWLEILIKDHSIFCSSFVIRTRRKLISRIFILSYNLALNGNPYKLQQNRAWWLNKCRNKRFQNPLTSMKAMYCSIFWAI